MEARLWYRSFSPALEQLAVEWAKQVCTTDSWTDLGPFGASESKPFRVENRGLIGLAKPGRQTNDGIARAAHEKIAADLAYHLRLPVPPVILWDRGNDEVPERHVSISAWAFSPAFTWDEAKAQLTDAHKSQLAPAVSAMVAFETWISAEDRKSDHVLVNLETPEGPPQIAYIDYAYSLSKVWQRPDAPHGVASSYIPVPRNEAALVEIANKIAEFDEATLNGIVTRILPPYLSNQQRETIMSNLTSRRQNIKNLVGLS